MGTAHEEKKRNGTERSEESEESTFRWPRRSLDSACDRYYRAINQASGFSRCRFQPEPFLKFASRENGYNCLREESRKRDGRSVDVSATRGLNAREKVCACVCV